MHFDFNLVQGVYHSVTAVWISSHDSVKLWWTTGVYVSRKHAHNIYKPKQWPNCQNMRSYVVLSRWWFGGSDGAWTRTIDVLLLKKDWINTHSWKRFVICVFYLLLIEHLCEDPQMSNTGWFSQKWLYGNLRDSRCHVIMTNYHPVPWLELTGCKHFQRLKRHTCWVRNAWVSGSTAAWPTAASAYLIKPLYAPNKPSARSYITA